MYQVHIRPGLINFLSRVTSKFETHIFTSASPHYANPILDYVCAAVRNHASDDSAGAAAAPIFGGRWCREHCSYNRAKDLSKIAKKHLHKIVLVDDTPDCFRRNPKNGIRIDPFVHMG